ncbi:unnamed protein product [Mycetohabitans rhizoxinica HKI 454]|uniref:Uncharacterized protein n=1 Tax=Mycetohabitans rhizoxinica (strain DSM 19002 / CIP 109453 / HKI 454) TaxID=882378 RepID=E5ATC2_MYCRK|nr:unnamed protein product [Mycetohabitans rhizoxinica HKI 454]
MSSRESLDQCSREPLSARRAHAGDAVKTRGTSVLARAACPGLAAADRQSAAYQARVDRASGQAALRPGACPAAAPRADAAAWAWVDRVAAHGRAIRALT